MGAEQWEVVALRLQDNCCDLGSVLLALFPDPPSNSEGYLIPGIIAFLFKTFHSYNLKYCTGLPALVFLLHRGEVQGLGALTLVTERH